MRMGDFGQDAQSSLTYGHMYYFRILFDYEVVNLLHLRTSRQHV